MTPSSILRKSFLIASCLLVFTAGAFAKDVTISDKLKEAFKQSFPDAEQVKWVESEDKYTVNFKQGDVLTRMDYDKDGNFISSLRYYSEKHLPVSVICTLHKKYPERKIFGVTEVTAESTVAYFVKLEDASNWYTVRCDFDGAMQTVEKYKKAD